MAATPSSATMTTMAATPSSAAMASSGQIPFAFGLSGPASKQPPAKKANTNTSNPVVDLLDFDPMTGIDVCIDSDAPSIALEDGYSPLASSLGSPRSRTPPRATAYAEPLPIPDTPIRIPNEDVVLADVYGLMFSQVTNHASMLNHLNQVTSDVSNLGCSVETLKTATQEAQSAAAIAITSVQALSVSVDQKFSVLEQRISAFSATPPTPAPATLPRTKPAPAAGVDHIEAVILGWPSFTRASIATPWLIALLDRVNNTDSTLSPIFRPIGGSFCKLGVFRFETYEDRRDFIAICKDTDDFLDFSHKGIINKLYIKASVPKDVAKDTDILRSAVFKCHEMLKPSVNTKEQLLTCYKTRTLTLFDTPIAFYIDAENFRLEAREGGEFCIDREVIARLATENGFSFDCNLLVQFLSKKLAGRTIVDK